MHPKLAHLPITDLVILRHAHSPDEAPSDHARVLDALGKSQAENIGQQLAAAGFVPQLVLCSDSVRTQQTWEQACKAWSEQPKLELHPELYDAEVSDWLRALKTVPTNISRVLIVGHNPTCEAFVFELTSKTISFGRGCAVRLRHHAGDWELDGQFSPVS